MVLFLILMGILLILATVVVLACSLGGAAFIIIFGDVVVCIAILAWIIKKKFIK